MAYLPERLYEDGNEQELAKALHDAMDISRRAFEPMRKTHWPRWYQLWNSRNDRTQFTKVIRGAPEYPWESLFGNSICIPAVFEQMETLIPRIVAGVLQNDPLVPIVPVIPPRDMDARPKYERQAKMVEAVLNNQLTRHVGIRSALVDWVTDCELFTVCWVFVDWVADAGEKWVLREVQGKPTVVRTEGGAGQDRIRVRRMSPWAVNPDPLGTSVDGQADSRPARYVQVADVINADDLVSRVKNSPTLPWTFKDADALTEAIDSVRGKIDSEDLYERELMVRVGRIDAAYGEGWQPENAADRNLVRVVKHWEKDRVVEYWGTRGSSVIACKQSGERYPYRLAGIPMVRLRTRPVPGEILGRGTAESCAGLNHLTSVLTNLMLTGMARSMINVVIGNDAAGVDWNKFSTQPFGFIRTDGSVKLDETLKMVNYPYVTADTWRMIEYFKYLLQLTGGAADLVSGVGSEQTPDTARAVGYLVEQNAARFNLKVGCMHEGIGQLGQKMLAVDAEYMRQDQIVDILGQRGNRDFIAVDPMVFADEYMCCVDTRPVSANPSVRAQQMMNAYQIGSATNPNYDKDEGLLELYRAMGVPFPGRMLLNRPDVAEVENTYFLQTGLFPPAQPAQPHAQHMQKHNEIYPEVQRMSAQAQANWQFHIMGEHARLAGVVGMQGGPMVTQPMQPGGPGTGQGAPQMPQAPARPGAPQGGVNVHMPQTPARERMPND